MDLTVLVLIVGVNLDVEAALALAVAAICHEVGHFAVARVLGYVGPLVLHAGGGRVYFTDVEGIAPRVVVLLSGPMAAIVPGAISLYLGYFGAELRDWLVAWTAYQLLPFPSLDGGQLLATTVLRRVSNPRLRNRVLWGLGLLTTVGLVAAWPGLAWLIGVGFCLALLAGFIEAASMYYADAFAAWESGDDPAVVRLASRMPKFLGEAQRESMVILGLSSAHRLDDLEAVERLAWALPAYHPERVRAAVTLARAGRRKGSVMAKAALTALDRGQVSPGEIDRTMWADLAFYAAAVTAGEGRDDAALSMLERAVDLGFDHPDRIEADPELHRLTGQPRFQRLLERLSCPA